MKESFGLHGGPSPGEFAINVLALLPDFEN